MGEQMKTNLYFKANILAVCLGTLAIVSSGCQRSTFFKSDDDLANLDQNFGRNPANSGSLQGWGPKKRALIMNFWNDTPIQDSSFSTYAADELKRGLHLSQRVVIPSDLKNDLATDHFLQGDRVKVAQLIREGRRLGVSVLVIGRIGKITYRQKGDDIGIFHQRSAIANVDVVNGREVMATSRSGEATSNAVPSAEEQSASGDEFKSKLTRLGIRQAVAALIPDFLRAIEKMTWQGRVAKIIGQKAYLNSGQASGLIAGDILKVLTPGDDIYDPLSGAYLGQAQGQMKGTLEVVDFIGPDGAVADIHTGAKPKEGDLVQLY
jgi:hypothetical protein